MTVADMLRDLKAEQEARRTYDRAVERHFIRAHQLVLEGKPDKADDVAKGAVALRTDARSELSA